MDQRTLIVLVAAAAIVFLPQIVAMVQGRRQEKAAPADDSALLTEMLNLKQNLAENGQCKAAELVAQAAVAVMTDKECQPQAKRKCS